MKSKFSIGTANFEQTKQIFEAVNNNNGLYPKNIFSNDVGLINAKKWARR